MSKISDLNYSQHITSADNFKPKNEVLNTWCGDRCVCRIAGGQDSRRNILSPWSIFGVFGKNIYPGLCGF